MTDAKSTTATASTSAFVGRMPLVNAKIAVEIFDGKGHFGMWQSEIQDALFQQGLDLAIEEEKPEDMEEKEWKTINRLACGTIRACLSREQKYPFSKETSANKLWRALEEKFLKKCSQNKLHLKKKLFRFEYVPGTTMNDHITKFNQLVTDLVNMDVKFEDEDLALMLLGSLPDEFEHLETTLLHGRSEVSLDEVTAALYSHEFRKKDKKDSMSKAADVLVMRGHSEKQKHGRRGRSKSRHKLKKDECAYCLQQGHWKKDCPKLKKDKGKGVIVNVNEKDEDSDFSLVVAEHDHASDLVLEVASSANSRSIWILDSGCCYHMCPHREWFSDLREIEGQTYYTADDKSHTCKGIGTIRLRDRDGTLRILTNVRYMPSLKRNLISTGVLEAEGQRVVQENAVMTITSGARVLVKGYRKCNNLYYYYPEIVIEETSVAAVDEDDVTKLWHMRLGHAGDKSLKALSDQDLLKGVQPRKLGFCEHCVKGKQTRVKFGTAIHDTKGILDYVHSDVWGPSKTASMGGKHYYVTFVDDFSRRVWVYTMKTKDEVLDKFIIWKKMVENQTNRRIKRLRTDNGGEYKSDPFMKVCEDEGIVRHFTVRDTPQQNGVAERMNRTLLEKVRCMLSNAGLGRQFWAEAVTYANHIINRLPSTAIGGKTPLEMWSGKPATDYDSLHVFGCTAYYHVKESKLDPRAKKALFMGITTGVKGYRLWCPETKKIIFSRDVTFDESTMLKKVTTEQTDGAPQQVENTSKQVEFETVIPVENDVNTPMVDEESDEEEIQPLESLQQHVPIALSKGKRTVTKPTRYLNTVASVFDDVPSTYSEAVQSSDIEKWRIAINEEMKSLQKNQTWNLTSLPKGKKEIGCKWVFTKKDGFPNKSDIRYKARLVAKGYAQKEGVDFNEVFSPVVKHSSIRILLALVAQLDLELVQLDVKTAFLHGDLEEEIYMTQPEGFKVAGKEKMVCRLRKSLYGLKQSPRQWYKRFDKFMIGQGYTRSKYDHCAYLRKLQDGSYVYLLLYVDDMLIASKSLTEIVVLKTQLSKEFEMKDLGEAQKILGMEITRDRKMRRLCLTQKEYLRKVLKRFGMNKESKPVSTPLAPHFKLSTSMSPENDAEREYMSKVPYASAVGSLMYAMVCTRPDVSQAVGVVSKYMHDPGKEHWQAVKWILRYISGTVDVGLVFQQDKQDGQCVVGYCDSDYAGDLDKRRSTTGYVFTFAKAPVSWKSTLQSTVALSTTEAEYMAITEAVKEAIWLQGLLEELGIVQKPIKLHCDSQSALHLAKNQVYHARTKHIDVRYHFVREILEEGGVLLQKIGTKENPADMLTKVVTAVKFQFCLDLINIVSC